MVHGYFNQHSRKRAFYAVALVCAFASNVSSGAEVPVSTARVVIVSGPAAGTYTFTSTDACVLAPLHKGGATTFAHVLMSPTSTLSIDIPDIDPAHINEFQVELVTAPAGGGDRSRLRTESSTATIDTRPDSSLEPYQRRERGKNGAGGRGTVKWQAQSSSARFEFEGETIKGVKMYGTLECRRLDREFGR